MSNKKSSRNYKVQYIDEKNVLEIQDKDGNKEYIPLVKYYGKWNYIAQLPKDTELDGEIYPKGTIIVWNGPATEDDRSYTIVVDPKYYDKHNSDIGKGWTREGTPDILNLKQITQDLRNRNAEDYTKYTKFLKSNNSQNLLNRVVQDVKSILDPAIGNQPIGDISSDTSGAVGALTTEYDNSSPTSSASSVSFDFIDDILGTKSSNSDKDNTDYDPNAVANNTIQNSDLNKIKKYTVNELVSAYSNAMQEILSNYGNKDMYSQYSRDSI